MLEVEMSPKLTCQRQTSIEAIQKLFLGTSHNSWRTLPLHFLVGHLNNSWNWWIGWPFACKRTLLRGCWWWPKKNHYTNTVVSELAIIMGDICHWQAASAAAKEEEEEEGKRVWINKYRVTFIFHRAPQQCGANEGEEKEVGWASLIQQNKVVVRGHLWAHAAH